MPEFILTYLKFEILIGVLFVLALGYFIVRQAKQRKREKFEKRDN